MRWADRSRRGLALVAFITTTAVACGVTTGSDSGGSTSTAPPAAPADGPTTSEDAEPATTTTSHAETTTSSSATGSEPIDSRDLSLELRPVLAIAPAAVGGTCDDLESGTSIATAPAGSDQADGTLLTDDEGMVCYLVGPAGAAGIDLTRSREMLQSGQWVIQVEARAGSRTKLNQLFDACYESAPTCPGTGDGNGAVAIVLDGVVVSAPTVNGPGLADDSFTISGDFTEDEARDIALALRMGG